MSVSLVFHLARSPQAKTSRAGPSKGIEGDVADAAREADRREKFLKRDASTMPSVLSHRRCAALVLRNRFAIKTIRLFADMFAQCLVSYRHTCNNMI